MATWIGLFNNAKSTRLLWHSRAHGEEGHHELELEHLGTWAMAAEAMGAEAHEAHARLS